MPQVDPQERQGDEREVEEDTVEVHEDEGKAVLDAEAAMDGGLSHRAGRRVAEEGLVVGATRVVARAPEADLDPEDEDGRREPGRAGTARR